MQYESERQLLGQCSDGTIHELVQERMANHHAYKSVEEVRSSVFKYIEVFYNRERRHQALGYVSPVQFERAVNAA